MWYWSMILFVFTVAYDHEFAGIFFRILQDISNHSNVKSLQVNIGQDTNTELQLQKQKVKLVLML